jgi:hypothetical protein
VVLEELSVSEYKDSAVQAVQTAVPLIFFKKGVKAVTKLVQKNTMGLRE